MGPNVDFNIDRNKIGANDFLTVRFTTDIDTGAFEARATLVGEPFGVGIGLLVGAFSTTPAGVERVFEIYDTELTKGDGEYRISLFAQSAADGTWNDNHHFWTSDGEPFYTSDGRPFLVVR